MIASKKFALTLLGLVLVAGAGNVLAYTLKAHPGKITDEELEKEKGGSGLRYSFDIQNGKVTQEVGVDAKTGELLENAPEGANPD
jgi:uncharacterized membrane protein YkoI